MKALIAFLFMAVAVLGAPRNVPLEGSDEFSYQTCSGHYKDGQCLSAVLPITFGDHSEFRIHCEIDSDQTKATITTVVQNALQRSTHLPDGATTIGYQIPAHSFLASLMKDSDYCQQTMTVTWDVGKTEDQFVGESASGSSHVFSSNGNFGVPQLIDLALLNMTGLLHFKNVSSESISWIALSPLRCVKRIEVNEDCVKAPTVIRPAGDRSEFAGFAEMGFLHFRLPKIVSAAFNVSPPVGKRVVKWWVYFRAPEDNWEFVKVISIGDFEISTGHNGHKIRVTNTKTNEHKDFAVDPLDVRLHLVSVKEAAPMNSFDDRNRTMELSVRVDAQIEQMSFYLLNNTNITVHAQQAVDDSAFGGCFAGIGFGYADGNSSNVSSVSGNGFKVFEEHPTLHKNLLQEMGGNEFTDCGISDPTLWTDGSSAIGRIGKYDPKNGSNLLLYLALAAVGLLLLALFGLTLVFFLSDKKERTRVDSETRTAVLDEK